ncbi:MAG: type VI secretion system contractile sheath large subunit, partial [Gammaproteobacteria bacterium]
MNDTVLESQNELSAETGSLSLLDQAIQATKQTDPDQTTELMKTLTEQALSGTVTWNRNVTATFKRAIEALDQVISKQLAEIMHHSKFQQLEGTWRGAHYLVRNSETSTTLKLRAFNATKKEVAKDLARAIDFDQSEIFKKLYENEFGTPGGEPMGALVGDYAISNHPDDIEMLSNMSHVAAAAFCPFLTAASPELFGFD